MTTMTQAERHAAIRNAEALRDGEVASLRADAAELMNLDAAFALDVVGSLARHASRIRMLDLEIKRHKSRLYA
jgi:hypothetical protein